MLYYKIRIYPKAQKDIKRILKYMEEYNGDKIVSKIYKDIDKLLFMPKMHKTLIYFKDKKANIEEYFLVSIA